MLDLIGEKQKLDIGAITRMQKDENGRADHVCVRGRRHHGQGVSPKHTIALATMRMISAWRSR
jgi:hypothetical protein